MDSTAIVEGVAAVAAVAAVAGGVVIVEEAKVLQAYVGVAADEVADKVALVDEAEEELVVWNMMKMLNCC